MKRHEKRNRFRLEFPVPDRPKLRLGAISADIIDLSEGGCVVEVKDASMQSLNQIGDCVSGTINFSDDSKVDVEGRVLRVEDNTYITIQFSNGPTFANMMTEHRRLLAKYHD